MGSPATEAGWHDPATGRYLPVTLRARDIAADGRGQRWTASLGVVFLRVGARVADRFQCTICPETKPKTARRAACQGVRSSAKLRSAMRRESLGIKFDPQRRRFRSLKGFLVDSGEYDWETLAPLRIVALLERSGGRASRRRLAARLRISLDAVDDAIEKLESTGVVTAARMQRGNDVTIALYRRGTASGRRAMTPLGAYDTSSYRRRTLTRKPN